MSKYYEGERRELQKFIPSNVSKVLEIGCGKGGFRQCFDKKIEYWGVEPNIEMATVAKNNLDVVINATYDVARADIPDNYFDLIVCNDVIEHMEDHDEFFETIKSKMNDNGKLLISIPNVRYIYNLYHLVFEKDWQYKDEGILDRTHLRFFTKKSLIRCLQNHEYKIINIAGINDVNPRGIKKYLKYILLVSGNRDTLSLQFAVLAKK